MQFTIAGTNIGSLRIRGLAMQVSGAPITPNSFSCAVGGTTYDSTTLPTLAQAVIEPGQGGSCSGTYVITTADIEAGVRSLDVAVSGTTATGGVLDTSQTVVVTPVRRPVLEAGAAVELCSNATSAGNPCLTLVALLANWGLAVGSDLGLRQPSTQNMRCQD